jgi:hypothetical protein
MNIKIILAMLVLLAARGFCEESYALKESQRIYPAVEGRGIGEIRRFQIHRGKNKVYERVEMDTDENGEIDSVQEVFWVNGEAVLSISDNMDGKGHYFTSSGNLSVSIQDQNGDGEPDHVMIITSDYALIEMYRKENGRFFEPISEKEFKEAVKAVGSVAPFANSVIESIQPEENDVTK